jgi:hypothetical protein
MKDRVLPWPKAIDSDSKELIPLIVIIAIILTIGITLISSKFTPEQTITKYNPMSEETIINDLRVIKTPTPKDNT